MIDDLARFADEKGVSIVSKQRTQTLLDHKTTPSMPPLIGPDSPPVEGSIFQSLLMACSHTLRHPLSLRRNIAPGILHGPVSSLSARFHRISGAPIHSPHPGDCSRSHRCASAASLRFWDTYHVVRSRGIFSPRPFPERILWTLAPENDHLERAFSLVVPEASTPTDARGP